MSVTITVLYDNRADDCRLKEGWGFSALIESGKEKILFDTGGDAAAFFSNAEKLQIPYHQLTHLMFSHKHWDHITGFRDIIKKVSKEITLCVPKTFSWRLKREASRFLKQIKIIRCFEEIAPNIYSLVLRGGFWLYEQALVIKTNQGLGIITGCAHPGIVHIMQEAQKRLSGDIAFVLGGFHMFSAPHESRDQMVTQFKQLNVKKVAPCHCSGDPLIRQFKEAYGANFCKVGTGTVLIF